MEAADLRAAWERHASEWALWARTPGHDSYWQFHRDLFLELVPPPGRRTLDLGCGEGRLSRHLSSLGHELVAVDASPTLAAAAREADPRLEVHVADAAALPFADASFDLVVAFMSLQDVDDPSAAIGESARVLEPGGRLCLAIVHPVTSAGTFAGREPDSPFVIDGSYLDASFYADEIERGGLAMTFTSAHRPLEAYTDALTGAGLLIERLREPAVPEASVTQPSARRWQRLPLFLQIRALKPAA
jgi:SAM-dependent methyltransferase